MQLGRNVDFFSEDGARVQVKQISSSESEWVNSFLVTYRNFFNECRNKPSFCMKSGSRAFIFIHHNNENKIVNYVIQLIIIFYYILHTKSSSKKVIVNVCKSIDRLIIFWLKLLIRYVSQLRHEIRPFSRVKVIRNIHFYPKTGEKWKTGEKYSFLL